jgi:hypothetical protein
MTKSSTKKAQHTASQRGAKTKKTKARRKARAAGALVNVTGDVNKHPRNIRLSRPVPNPPRMADVEHVCALTDPFCPMALGAKIPDGNARSMTAAGRGVFTMATTSTNTKCAAAIAPCGGFGYYTADGATFPIGSATWTGFSNLLAGTLFANNAANVRTVTAGFILRAVQTASTAQGFFTIQTQQAFNPSFSTVAGDFIAYDNVTISNYPGMEYSYIFKPINRTLAIQFLAPGSSTSQSNFFGWPTAVIFFQGGNGVAGSIAAVEYFINVEWTVNDESVIAPLMPPPVLSKPNVQKATDRASSTAPSVIKGGVQTVGAAIKEKATEALTDLATEAFEEMSAMFAAFI